MSEAIMKEKGTDTGISQTLGGDRTIRDWLFNPFQYLAGGPALGIGVVVMLAMSLIGSLSNTHFDGVLDIHAGLAAPLWIFPVEGLINWLCLVVVLWGAGLVVARSRFRFLDLLGTQALARWPFLLLSPAALLPSFQRMSAYLAWKAGMGEEVALKDLDGLVFGSVVLVTLAVICWAVVLMYKAFSVSCNVRGGKAIGVFAGGLFLAEIVSKILIYLLVTYGA